MKIKFLINYLIINKIISLIILFILFSCLEDNKSKTTLATNQDSIKNRSPKLTVITKDSTKINIDSSKLLINDSALTREKKKQEKIIYKKVKNEFLIGDFDGNGVQDTLIQRINSKKSQKEITFFPDPFQNEWETVIKFFYGKKADVILYIPNSNIDTLHLGTAMGLYCLISVGDTNKDGKDEIALVVDYLDYSMVNTCGIYSLCEGKWKLMKSFTIYESAFFFDTVNNESPKFNQIKDFLEKKDNAWKYKGYNETYDRPEDVGGLRTLKVRNCN